VALEAAASGRDAVGDSGCCKERARRMQAGSCGGEWARRARQGCVQWRLGQLKMEKNDI
jgi:hypothetical protein